MALDGDGDQGDQGRYAREPLTPLYNATNGDTPAPAQRGPRNGPLGARLSQRNRVSQPPATSDELSQSPSAPYTPYAPGPLDVGEAPAQPGGEYVPSSRVSPSWGRVTGQLKLDDKVTGALQIGHQFGATWGSRSEMLRACLDEYYRLVASSNEARRLLELTDGDVEALRRERNASSARLREVEARLEFQSRSELRSVYLGAAEIETRLFRAEEERSLLSSRIELLEGFMMFLTRIIATVRAIPANVLIGGETAHAAGASGVNPQETVIARDLKERRSGGAAASSGKRAKPGAGPESPEIEEFVLDERDVALLASSEFEIIEILDDDPTQASANGATPATPATPSTDDAAPAADSPGDGSVSGADMTAKEGN